MKKTICIADVGPDEGQGIYELKEQERRIQTFAKYVEGPAVRLDHAAGGLEQFKGARLMDLRRRGSGLIELTLELPDGPSPSAPVLAEEQARVAVLQARVVEMHDTIATASRNATKIIAEVDQAKQEIERLKAANAELVETLQAERHGRPPNPCPACGEEFLPAPLSGQEKKEMIERILGILAPKTGGVRFPIFEWAHESTPTDQEVEELAGRIADAVSHQASAPLCGCPGPGRFTRHAYHPQGSEGCSKG